MFCSRKKLFYLYTPLRLSLWWSVIIYFLTCTSLIFHRISGFFPIYPFRVEKCSFLNKLRVIFTHFSFFFPHGDLLSFIIQNHLKQQRNKTCISLSLHSSFSKGPPKVSLFRVSPRQKKVLYLHASVFHSLQSDICCTRNKKQDMTKIFLKKIH
jgi:hypothetical protein